MKQIFIDSAVHVVARDGLVKATTKAIAAGTGLNEAYIYHCFKSKEELLSAAFHQEDVNLIRQIRKALPVMHFKNLTWKERCFLLWRSCWNFILEKPDDLLFYLRYYYSALVQSKSPFPSSSSSMPNPITLRLSALKGSIY